LESNQPENAMLAVLTLIFGMSNPGLLQAAPDSTAPDSLRTIVEEGGTRRFTPRPQLMLLPIIFSSPDTRWSGGVLPQVVFHLPGAGRPSSARIDAFYTQNEQFTFRARSTLWLPEDRNSVGFNVAWKKWPTSFYGIGSVPEDTFRESYTERFLEGQLVAVRRIQTSLYAGVQYDFRLSRSFEYEPGSVVGGGELPGSVPGTASSVGLVFRYDTRNHDFYPSAGGLYQVTTRAGGPATGSDYTYSSAELDGRRYLRIDDRQTLALQGVVRVTGGSPPFQMLPSVGSVFRGYATPRYIDANLAAMQVEYRVMPLFWRVGFVGFAGIAQTGPELKDLVSGSIRYVAGGGLRLLVSRRDRVSIRWDYGIGQSSSGDYLDLGEAF
jgi:outer membrane protein assembly factor BamA